MAALEETTATSLREREVHRYYQPWLYAQGSSLNVASHVAHIGQQEVSQPGEAQASRDQALTAFAQLACLRLDVKRAMVSLIDSQSQMILADATRDVSLTAEREPWLGSNILARSKGICELCLVNTYTASNSDGQKLTCKAMVVNDCRLDERFRNRSYVTEEPGIRFYAGVPIRSQAGHEIGVYAVSDDKPRNGVSIEELLFMEQTASAIMEHLEWARDRVNRFKGERVVRGMAAFIEGASSIQGPTSHAIHHPGSQPDQQQVAVLADEQSPLETRRPDRRLPNASHSQQSKNSSPRRADSITRVFGRAADLLLESTFADGAVIFAAAPETHLHTQHDAGPGFETASPRPNSLERSTSDSDTSPAVKPCKVVALSLTSSIDKGDMPRDMSITIGTLERYSKVFSHGKTFVVNEEGFGFSSGDDSASNDEARGNRSGTRRKARMDHRELLHKLPGARSITFLPLYDGMDEKLVAGCFLWTSVVGRMRHLDEDIVYLRAFGNSIMSEIARVNMQKDEAAKTTFIASMSHELRSPLHGILGAAELLKDTSMESFQTGLVSSISTCGRTLLDTLNHVLDYSKINKLGRTNLRRHARQSRIMPQQSAETPLESLNITAEVDLATLVEEVMDAITAGHSFARYTGLLSRSMQGNKSDHSWEVRANVNQPDQRSDEHVRSNISVLLDFSPRASWMVRTQPGAIRRVIMNLLGNSLKYTSSGFVAVTLRAQEDTRNGRLETLIRVVDSGKGMSADFQDNRLFLPFSQEDTFQPGTGLGLSIVKQIVDSLGGSIEVKSQQGYGTEVDVRLTLATAEQPLRDVNSEFLAVIEQTRKMKVVLVDALASSADSVASGRPSRLEETLRSVCSLWFEMNILRADGKDEEDAELYLYCEPSAIQELLDHEHKSKKPLPHNHAPIVIVCSSAEEAASVSRYQAHTLHKLGYTVETVAQPCGPRKLAKVFKACLENKGKPVAAGLTSDLEIAVPDTSPLKPVHGTAATHAANTLPHFANTGQGQLQPPVSKFAASLRPAPHCPSPPPLNPDTPLLEATNANGRVGHSDAGKLGSPHCLIVDDNRINRQLLAMFMKKAKLPYVEAEDGQEAVDCFRDACLPGADGISRGRPFDCILMDVSMPVMDGMEATRQIRSLERENGLRRTTIIALTGLASAQAQEDAAAAGIDVFLPKPVKFAALHKLLNSK